MLNGPGEQIIYSGHANNTAIESHQIIEPELEKRNQKARQRYYVDYFKPGFFKKISQSMF